MPDARMSIQRVPWGMLDYLGLKGSGDNPTTLSNVVSPVVDFTNAYLYQRWVTFSLPTINMAAGFITTAVPSDLQAPAGSLMIFDQLHFRSSAIMGAGTTIRAALMAYNSQTLLPFAMGESSSATVGEFGSGTWNPAGLVLRPGEGVGLWCNAFAGITQPYTIAGRFAYLTI